MSDWVKIDFLEKGGTSSGIEMESKVNEPIDNTRVVTRQTIVHKSMYAMCKITLNLTQYFYARDGLE
jgi:hypothetical protein